MDLVLFIRKGKNRDLVQKMVQSGVNDDLGKSLVAGNYELKVEHHGIAQDVN